MTDAGESGSWAADLVPAEAGAGSHGISRNRSDDEHCPDVVVLPSNHARHLLPLGDVATETRAAVGSGNGFRRPWPQPRARDWVTALRRSGERDEYYALSAATSS